MPYNLFISHKHSDAQIAQVIADFVSTKSLGMVSVHVSSDPHYNGPRLGKSLNQELCNALQSSDILILVYSSSDEDWSYCMYECGVATDPKSPHTNIIVFQCGRDSPSPFNDQLRVNARNLDDIRKFTKAFFTDPTFFPNGTKALASSFKETQCDEAADQLYLKLNALGVLPPLEVQPTEDVLAWPSLKLQVAEGVIEKVIGSSVSQVHEICEKLLREQASVIESTNRASLLFGMTSLPPNVPFSELVKRANPGASLGWLHCLTEQVRCLANRQALPNIRWEQDRKSVV